MSVHSELRRGVVRLSGPVAALVGACLVVATAGCTPDLRSTEFACSEQSECAPMGRVCQQGWCVLPDQVIPDAGTPTDAPMQPPDAPSCTPPAVDTPTNASLEGGTRLEWTHTVGDAADRMLVVGISYRAVGAAAVVERVRAGESDLTLIRADGVAGAGRTELWGLANPLSGAQVMEVRFDLSVDLIAGSISFSGVDATTPLGMNVGTTGTSGNPAVTVPSAPGHLVVGCVGALGGGTNLTVGAGQTEQWSDSVGNGNNGVTGAASIEAGAASVSTSWNIAGNAGWALSAVAVQGTCP